MRKFNIDCRGFPQFMEYIQLLASSVWKMNALDCSDPHDCTLTESVLQFFVEKWIRGAATARNAIIDYFPII